MKEERCKDERVERKLRDGFRGTTPLHVMALVRIQLEVKQTSTELEFQLLGRRRKWNLITLYESFYRTFNRYYR